MPQTGPRPAMTAEPHVSEYHEAMVALLEWICESRREYERMRGEGRPEVVKLIGEAKTDHMIEDWRSLVVVCEQGELRQGYTRGRRPP